MRNFGSLMAYLAVFLVAAVVCGVGIVPARAASNGLSESGGFSNSADINRTPRSESSAAASEASALRPNTINRTSTPASNGTPTLYSLTDLGALLGASDSEAVAINNNGQVIGNSWRPGDADHPAGPSESFLWTPTSPGATTGALRDLVAPGAHSAASDINDAGQVVGIALYPKPQPDPPEPPVPPDERAAAWTTSGTIAVRVGSLGDGYGRVNNSGQVLGHSGRRGGLWSPDFAAFVPFPPVTTTGPGGIVVETPFGPSLLNDRGQVVGNSDTPNGRRTFLASSPDADYLDLGSFCGQRFLIPTGLSAAGDIVGRAVVDTSAACAKYPSGGFFAFLWHDGTLTDLTGVDVLPGGSTARAINASGAIVGSAGLGAVGGNAVIWQNGIMTDLNNLIPTGSSLTLADAWDINDRGQIVGIAYTRSATVDENPRAFLLTPDFPHFWQGGVPGAADLWGADALGDTTLAKSGCVVTAAAMILRHYQINEIWVEGRSQDVNPRTLNKWLVEHHRFVGDNKTLMVMADLELVALDSIALNHGYSVNLVKDSRDLNDTCVKCLQDFVKSQLVRGYPVNVRVKGRSSGKPDGHSLILTDYLGGGVFDTYTIEDPAQRLPGVYFLSSDYYGNTWDRVQALEPGPCPGNPACSGSALVNSLDSRSMSASSATGVFEPQLRIAAPPDANLLVIDPLGHRTGVDESGTSFQEIPGATVWLEEGVEDVDTGATQPGALLFTQVAPTPGPYTIKVTASAADAFTLSFDGLDANGNRLLREISGSAGPGQPFVQTLSYAGPLRIGDLRPSEQGFVELNGKLVGPPEPGDTSGFRIYEPDFSASIHVVPGYADPNLPYPQGTLVEVIGSLATAGGRLTLLASDVKPLLAPSNRAGTGTSVGSSANPSVFGQSVSFTAQVSVNALSAGSPAGSVQFQIDGVNFGSPVALSGGAATSDSTSTLTVRAHAITATYSGDANFNGSSGSFMQTVNKAVTTTSITAESPDPSVIGEPYAVTVAVMATTPNAGTPTGLVDVSEGAASCTLTLAAGTGSCSLASTTAGTKILAATYGGDGNHNGSFATTAHRVNTTDTTAPVTTATPVPSPNGNAWNNGDVTVNLAATDEAGGSGVRDIQYTLTNTAITYIVSGASASVLVTDEGLDTLDYFATDDANNAEAAHRYIVRIDRTAPVVTGTRSTAANANGWNSTPVAVHFEATDALSGIDGASTFDTTLAGEGASQSAGHIFLDRAGNPGSATVVAMNIDLTPPALTFAAPTPAANSAGWNNTDVTIAFSATDALSGLDGTNPLSPLVLAREGDPISAMVSATDRAGNSAGARSPAVKIDKTAPTITSSQSPSANAAGWNNTDVTVSFACADVLSGIASCTPQTVIRDGGAGQNTEGIAVDLAGNRASTSRSLNIDKTAPITATRADPGPNGAGWNNTNVTVSLTASDASGGSGVKDLTYTLSGAQTGGGTVSGSALSLVITSEGLTTLTYRARDTAGNLEVQRTLTVRIDKTAPEVTKCAVRPAVLWPPDHKMVLVRITLVWADALSGGSGFKLTALSSSEPDEGLGDGDFPNDSQGFDVGTPDVDGSLRAERSGRGPGRIYTLAYEMKDLAENATRCSAAIAVAPHDQGR